MSLTYFSQTFALCSHRFQIVKCSAQAIAVIEKTHFVKSNCFLCRYSGKSL